MPWECQNCCVDDGLVRFNDPTQLNPSEAWANMGYVGFVRLESTQLASVLGTSTLGQTLRVTDFGVGLSQDIDKPDVIDGRIDRTVYKLGPRIVEGTMSMPVIVDTFALDTCPTQDNLFVGSTAAGNMINTIWCWATTRNQEGRMAFDDMDMHVRYANHAAFTYSRSMVNELTFRVAQGDMVTSDVSVFSRARRPYGGGTAQEIARTPGDPFITDYLSPARILTWNDVTVTGIGGCSAYNPGSALFLSNTVRTWEMTVANNLDRFYTFNGSLYPADINAGVRDVTGSLEFMGLNDLLREHTSGGAAGEDSGLQSHFTEKNELRFVFYVGAETYKDDGSFDGRDWINGSVPPPGDGAAIFWRRLMAVIYEIEEMSLSNDLYTTTVNYHGLANDSIDGDALYEAFIPASSYFPSWY